MLEKVCGFRDRRSLRTRSLAILEARRNGWRSGEERKDGTRETTLLRSLGRGQRACSFSRVASATEYLPSLADPLFPVTPLALPSPRHFAGTGTFALSVPLP
jgi:hypothetical protein